MGVEEVAAAEFTDRKATRVLFINQSEAAALRLLLRDIDGT